MLISVDAPHCARVLPLVASPSQVGITADDASTTGYGVAVPALKELLRSPSEAVDLSKLRRLLGHDQHLLDALIANDIVLAIPRGLKVEFQSRAARFFVERLPPPPPWWWRWRRAAAGA